ncbi:MAG: ATP-binding protein [Clostridiales bacterium]|nr:ATP-binding protein [Clostridiales bacterium]MBQ1572923.1 ATP-binding protein [Clostridiales bacterium]
MSIPVFVIGRSGSGKTYSIKNFKADEVGVISVEKGRLPFKTDIKTVKIPKDFTVNTNAQLNAAKYAWIEMIINKSKAKSIIIDDSQYLLVNELFDRSKEKGYDKFTDIAVNFRNLVHFVNDMPDDDKIVYFLHHSESDTDGREKAKTIGRMLDEKLTLEGCFDIVLYCQDHKFYTQAEGMSTAKTPEGLFDDVEIPNDLKAVDKAIREYYGLNGGDA